MQAKKTLLLMCTLVLLYWACILREWSTPEEAQAVMLPYIAFAFGVGVLLSVFKWERPIRSVFLVSSAIPIISIILHTGLFLVISEAHAGDIKGNQQPDSWQTAVLVAAIPAVIGLLHGVVSLAGYQFAVWIKAQLVNVASATSNAHSLLTEQNVKLATAVIGLAVAIIGAIVGKK